VRPFQLHAAEDQCDDAARHVLVHPGQRDRLDIKAGFFGDFSSEPCLDGFVEF